MDLFDAIAARHSYRGAFTAAPVPRADLLKIVQAGIQAPSAKNEQVISFVMVDDPDTLKQIAAMMNRSPCDTARAMIVCVADPRPVMEDISFAVEDCAACVENMLLAVAGLGYATVWIDGALRRENRAQRLAELLGVPPNKLVQVLLPIGVPADRAAQKEKQPLAQRAWWNRYGAAG